MPETFEVSDALLEKFLAQHVEVDPKPLFAEGTIVGEWTLTGFLGRGGSAEVYCARQQSNGQAVAIKVLHRTEPEQLERFAKQFRLPEKLISVNGKILSVRYNPDQEKSR